jgi:transcriptional regulator with XRE-family HTH domain
VFQNLGKALALVRELRGKTQAQVARAAGVGKSQLSKYENGKELPKLDSLEKLLDALGVSAFDFFYTVTVVNERASSLDRLEGPIFAWHPWHPPVPGNSLLPAEAEASFAKIFSVILGLHGLFYSERLFGGRMEAGGGPNGSQERAQAPESASPDGG